MDEITQDHVIQEDYLHQHHLQAYFEDCVHQMLLAKDDKLDPALFISQYFSNVKNGRHVMFREYSFILLTPHNRLSFIRLVWTCFSQIGRTKDLLSIHEYHSLITLICPDFPFDLLYKIARIILLDDALDCLISFSDFIFTFQLQFYYLEFLEKVLEIYTSLLQGEATIQDTVVVPSGEETKPVIHTDTHQTKDEVPVVKFLRFISPICDSTTISTVDIGVLRELLTHDTYVTFYGLLMMLARSETINAHLGVLPKKSEQFMHIHSLSLNEPVPDSSAKSHISTTTKPSACHLKENLSNTNLLIEENNADTEEIVSQSLT